MPASYCKPSRSSKTKLIVKQFSLLLDCCNQFNMALYFFQCFTHYVWFIITQNFLFLLPKATLLTWLLIYRESHFLLGCLLRSTLVVSVVYSCCDILCVISFYMFILFFMRLLLHTCRCYIPLLLFSSTYFHCWLSSLLLFPSLLLLPLRLVPSRLLSCRYELCFGFCLLFICTFNP